MKEAEYPSTQTKPHENHSSQSYMGSFLSTPQSDSDSTQFARYSGMGVEKQSLHDSAVPAKRKREDKRVSGGNDCFDTGNEKLDQCNNNLRSEIVALKAQVDELTAAYDSLNMEKSRSEKSIENIVMDIMAHYATSKGLHPDDLTSESLKVMWNTFNREVEVSKSHEVQGTELKKSLRNLELCQDEARGLRTELQELQKEMLAQVSNNEVITDEVFSRDFHALASLVKSLSRSVQPAQNIDILDALKPVVLLRDVSKHHWDTRARRKAYVEAWIWSVLITTVFQYFLGFSENFIKLHETWRFIFGNGRNWPKPTPESETWRFMTAYKLVGDIGRETVITGQSHEDRPGLNAYDHHLQREVLKRRASVTQTIKLPLTAVALTSDLSHISDVVNKAFELALNMSLQRFRVQVAWPGIGQRFDANWMTPVPDRSGEDIREGVVASIVNPGLVRFGNTHGQNFDVSHVIVPSLVQLEPVQTMRKASHVPVSVKREPEGI